MCAVEPVAGDMPLEMPSYSRMAAEKKTMTEVTGGLVVIAQASVRS
jgi:hypothetical protein